MNLVWMTLDSTHFVSGCICSDSTKRKLASEMLSYNMGPIDMTQLNE